MRTTRRAQGWRRVRRRPSADQRCVSRRAAVGTKHVHLRRSPHPLRVLHVPPDILHERLDARLERVVGRRDATTAGRHHPAAIRVEAHESSDGVLDLQVVGGANHGGQRIGDLLAPANRRGVARTALAGGHESEPGDHRGRANDPRHGRNRDEGRGRGGKAARVRRPGEVVPRPGNRTAICPRKWTHNRVVRECGHATAGVWCALALYLFVQWVGHRPHGAD